MLGAEYPFRIIRDYTCKEQERKYKFDLRMNSFRFEMMDTRRYVLGRSKGMGPMGVAVAV